MSETTRTDRLFPKAYASLRRLAEGRLHGDRAGRSLSPSDLVHEIYLRLMRDGSRTWESSSHFYFVAAEAARRILVERARRRLAMRHGGGLARVPLDERIEEVGPAEEILALDEGLARLERHHPRKARVVELRYFAGFSVEETAALLGVSTGTVKLDWTFARAWLRRTLRHGPD
jgi:RNA polymerase sigma factor (TIGR02999 family)